eukprot:716145-Prorocentrum_lima.AAC.1
MQLLAHGDAVGDGAARAIARLAPCIGCRNDDLDVDRDIADQGLPPEEKQSTSSALCAASRR